MSLKQDQALSQRLLLRSENRIEREILLNYTDSLRAVNKEMRGLYKKYAVNGELTHAEMTRYNRAASMRKQLDAALAPYVRRNNELLKVLAESQYEASFYRRAWSYDNDLKAALNWGQIPVKQVRAAVWNKYNLGSLRKLGQNTRLRLQRAVTQGLTRGSSLPRMMRDIRGVMGISSRDAMRIARTEAHRAREVGNLMASQEAESQGVDLWRVWDAALDDRTRSSHAALDGKRVRPGEKFNGRTEYPGGFGDPGEDINCRCTVTDVIEGYEPEARRTREGVQPYQTFRTWAKGHGVTGSRYGQRYNFI